jgi:hypothetical protein
VIVVKNTILLPRKQEQIFFDGGDCIHTSFPVAITHGSYPKQPGSLLASAVKVVDADNWNTDFEALMGVDIGVYFQAFQYSAFFFMAMEDDTVVTLQNNSTVTLQRGEGSMVYVNQ